MKPLKQTKEKSKWGDWLWTAKCPVCRCTVLKPKWMILKSKTCVHCKPHKGLLSHGESGSPLYQSWNAMKQRCTNPNCKSYSVYGGRGITFTKGWSKYTTFRKWAKKSGWAKGLTLDRINNDGNYKPSNCQWLTRAENARKGGD